MKTLMLIFMSLVVSACVGKDDSKSSNSKSQESHSSYARVTRFHDLRFKVNEDAREIKITRGNILNLEAGDSVIKGCMLNLPDNFIMTYDFVNPHTIHFYIDGTTVEFIKISGSKDVEEIYGRWQSTGMENTVHESRKWIFHFQKNGTLSIESDCIKTM